MFYLFWLPDIVQKYFCTPDGMLVAEDDIQTILGTFLSGRPLDNTAQLRIQKLNIWKPKLILILTSDIIRNTCIIIKYPCLTHLSTIFVDGLLSIDSKTIYCLKYLKFCLGIRNIKLMFLELNDAFSMSGDGYVHLHTCWQS